MKQTVEEAKKDYSFQFGGPDIEDAPFTYVEMAFVAGAEWQRDQGIDWIMIKTTLVHGPALF